MPSNVLVVEDDAIIGRHIHTSLKRLGYVIQSVVSTGEEAVEVATEHPPDLVLMDISLAGEMDGIEAAALIRKRAAIPVVFLTAYADPATLQRAKISDPFGYLLKPFDERILQITIEMALYKYKMERRLVEREEMLRTLVENQGEGVAIFDPSGKVIFCNPALEQIVATQPGGLVGHYIYDFLPADQFELINTQMSQRSRGARGVYEAEINRSNSERRTVSITATPWIEENGAFAGSFAIIRDVTEQKLAEQAERQARLLAETLRETASVLSSSLDLEEVLNQILINVKKVVACNGALVILTVHKPWLIHVISDREGNGPHPMHKSFSVAEHTLIDQAIRANAPVLVPDVDKVPGLTMVPVMTWLKTFLALPMAFKGQNIGFIVLGNSHANAFSEKHVQDFAAFAAQAALAVENARLFEETRRRAEYLALLNEITRAAISAITEDQTLRTVVEKMAHLFKSDGAYMTSWDEERQYTIPIVAHGTMSESYTNVLIQPGELTLTASALCAGKVLAVEDLYQCDFIDPSLARQFSLKSMLVLPLIADGNWLGAALIGYVQAHKFSPEEIEMGEQVSDALALVVSKARLYSQVQRMAITDELTGLFNRRGIFEKGRDLLKKRAAETSPIALIWLDIDHFKEVNDGFGHHIGDQVVRAVAQCVREAMRDQDCIGRYGGEGGDELIIIIPDTGLHAAYQVAERLRQRIAETPFATESGPVYVTVSLGVSVLSGADVDLSGLLNRADQAMYAAKSAGRNCVVVVEEA